MAAIKVVRLSKGASRVLSRSYSSIASSLWTPDNIVTSPFKPIEIPDRLITEHTWENLGKWSDKTAVVCGISGKSYTYHHLYKHSRNLAATFRSKFKIKDGDAICVMMQNCLEYPLAALGILGAGAVMTTINPLYTAYEAQRQILLSDPKIIIGSTDTVNTIKEALKLAKKDIPVITVRNETESLPNKTVNFEELIQDGVDTSVMKDVRKGSGDVAMLPYSSGTTGLPKGVELTNRNIVANCLQQDVEGVKHHSDTTASHQDVVLAVVPLYHIYGLVIIMLHKLSVGAKLVTLPRFQPTAFLSAIKRENVSLLHVVPPIVLFMGSHPDVKREDLQSIEKIMSGAAPCAKPDIDRTLEKLPSSAEFIQLYGLTETSPLAVTMTGSTNYTAIGYAISNTELKITDGDGKALGPDQVGEVYIRGPQVMKGYRNNLEATRNAITEDGWFKSGDLASIDAGGVVTVADRLKELIKVKGFQVPPAELESLLKEHPAVLDAGVVGVPDPRMGETPKAFVVLKDGHKAEAQDIKNFVQERVAEFKRLNEVVFLDSLPKNPSGKLLRRVLKEKYC